MKKVFFVTEDLSFKAGVTRVLTLIANELSKKYDVSIISLFNEKEEPAFHINNKVKVYKILHGHKRREFKFLYPFLKFYLKRFLKKFEIDYFIVTEVRTFSLFKFLKGQTKLIAWEHLNSFMNTKDLGKFYLIGRENATKYADKIIVLTDKDKNNYNKVYKTKENQVVRIYNPIELNNQNHKYDLNSKCIISVGRLTGQKGFDYLVEVAKYVFEKHKDWQWHIYGDGSEKDNLEKLINKYNLQENVILKGHCSNISELYKEYAMFVMTSRYEGFPMVNIEAHSAKLPIVSFDCPCGPSEMIIDGENGYIIDCFNIEKMADKINYLIEHAEIRQMMSDNTSKDKEKLKIENIIQEWEKVLD